MSYREKLVGDVSGVVGDPSHPTVVTAIQGNPVSAFTPTTGQFLGGTGSSHLGIITITGTDINSSAVTAGLLTVTGVQGIAVPVPSGSNTVLTFNAGAYTWSASGGSGITQLTGDVTAGPGSGSQAATVVNIHGASVPAAGSLTTGNVLQVSGASALTYGAVNLAGGANFVTGVLPAGNQAAQTMGGDVTGTTTASTVAKIQGNTVTSGALVKGDLFIATTTSNWAGTAVTGDVSFSTATPGLTTVLAINGTTVPATPTANQVLVATSGTTSTWQLIANAEVSTTAAIAVSKLAAGTSAQVLLNNGTPTPTWTSITGDVSLTNAGVTTVTALQGNAVKSQTLGAGQDQFILTWNNATTNWQALPNSGGSGITQLTGDVTAGPGSGSQAATVVSITGSSGVVNISSSGNVLTWAAATTAPGITQSSTSTASGATLTVQAQGTTGASHNGGNLILASGTSGSATAGNLQLQVGSATELTLTDALFQWATGITNPKINQADKTTNSGVGSSLTIQAQNETGTTSTGGQLVLTSGTGTTAAGSVVLQTGGTTRLTANATGVITIANLSTGVVHADSSGNLTSSTIVNADVSATANIAVSKLAAGTSAQILQNNGTPTPTWTTVSGDVSITNAGVTTVGAIQGQTVTSGALVKGDLLIATSTSNWAATAVTGDVSFSTATPGATTVTAIQGNTVTSGALTKGQFFVASSTSNWAATTLSGDVSESSTTAGALTVTALQGNAVKSQTLGAGQDQFVLTWVNSASQWQAQVNSGGSGITQLTGDVTAGPGSGSQAATVAKIQGVTISGTPSTGQVLTATSSTAADWQTPSGGGGVGVTRSSSITSTQSTSSTSFVDLPQMSVTFTATAAEVTVYVALGGLITGSASFTTYAQIVSSAGTTVTNNVGFTQGNNLAWSLPLATVVTGLTVGNSVTIKVQWKVDSGGTATINPANAFASGNIIVSDASTTTGGSASFISVNQTAHGFTTGQAVYYTGSTWALAESNASSTLSFGVVSVVDANNFNFYFVGQITGLSGLTAGQYYYVSDTSAGTLTTTEPSASTSFSNPILFAISTTVGIVIPFRPNSIASPASTSTFITVTQTAHGFSTGQAAYYTGSAWALAEANSANTLSFGVVSVIDSNNFNLYLLGQISGLSGLTAGQYYFVSDVTPGLLTTTEPTAASSFSNPLMFAISTTTGIVIPYRPSGIQTPGTTLFTSVGNPAVHVVSSTTETNLFSYTLPANTMPNNGELRIRALGQIFANNGSNQTQTFRLYLGSTLLITGTVSNGPSATNFVTWEFEGSITNVGATNVQYASFHILNNNGSTSGNSAGNASGNTIQGWNNTGAVDTTVNQTVKLTVQNGANTSNLFADMYMAKVMLF